MPAPGNENIITIEEHDQPAHAKKVLLRALTSGGVPVTLLADADGTLHVNASVTPSGTQDVNIVSTVVLPVNDNGNSLTVDGIVSIGGAVDTELPPAAALADNTANPTVPAVGAFGMVWDGTDWSRIREIANALNSTGTGILASGLVGQFDDTAPTLIIENQFGNVRMSANRNLYVRLRDNAGNERGLNISAESAAAIAGDVAHDAVDAGNPLLMGGRAHTSEPTAVANNDRVRAYLDEKGYQHTAGSVGVFDHGRKSSIGTTAVQITTTSIVARQGVLVKSSVKNSVRLFVGNSDVTADSADATDGVELAPGDWVMVPVDNANKVYVIAESGTASKVFWQVA